MKVLFILASLVSCLRATQRHDTAYYADQNEDEVFRHFMTAKLPGDVHNEEFNSISDELGSLYTGLDSWTNDLLPESNAMDFDFDIEHENRQATRHVEYEPMQLNPGFDGHLVGQPGFLETEEPEATLKQYQDNEDLLDQFLLDEVPSSAPTGEVKKQSVPRRGKSRGSRSVSIRIRQISEKLASRIRKQRQGKKDTQLNEQFTPDAPAQDQELVHVVVNPTLEDSSSPLSQVPFDQMLQQPSKSSQANDTIVHPSSNRLRIPTAGDPEGSLVEQELYRWEHPIEQTKGKRWFMELMATSHPELSIQELSVLSTALCYRISHVRGDNEGKLLQLFLSDVHVNTLARAIGKDTQIVEAFFNTYMKAHSKTFRPNSITRIPRRKHFACDLKLIPSVFNSVKFIGDIFAGSRGPIDGQINIGASTSSPTEGPMSLVAQETLRFHHPETLAESKKLYLETMKEAFPHFTVSDIATLGIGICYKTFFTRRNKTVYGVGAKLSYRDLEILSIHLDRSIDEVVDFYVKYFESRGKNFQLGTTVQLATHKHVACLEDEIKQFNVKTKGRRKLEDIFNPMSQ